MKKKTIYLSLLFASLLASGMVSTTVQAQTVKKKIAEKYFLGNNYQDALPIYEELAKQALKKNAKGAAADWEMLRRAAQGNYYTRKYSRAEMWYSLLAQNRQASLADLYELFEACRYQGKYSRADSLLRVMETQNPGMQPVNRYAHSPLYYQTLIKDSTHIHIGDLPINKGLGDFGPAFFDKGIVFASSRLQSTFGNNRYGRDHSNLLNVYYAEPDGAEHTKVVRLKNKLADAGSGVGPVYFSPDGKTAFVTINRLEYNRNKTLRKLSLYIVQKGKNDKWGVPQPFKYNSDEYSLGLACLSADGRYLYYASDMPGGIGGVDIWRSKKMADGWAQPENLGNPVNTPQDEMFPFVAQNNSLYFASKGHVGLGGFDLFEARQTANGFVDPVNMGYPLNSRYDDFALILDKNASKGYFSSDRQNYVDRIYSVEIHRLPITLTGTLRDAETATPVSGEYVVVKNLTLGDSVLVKTDSQGRLQTPLQPNSRYEVYLLPKSRGEQPQKQFIDTHEKQFGADFNIELAVKKEVRNYVLKIMDEETGLPIAHADIQVVDKQTDEAMLLNTDENGNLNIRAKPEDCGKIKEYYIINKAKGYTPDKKWVSLQINCIDQKANTTNKPSQQLNMTKVNTGIKFEIKNIFYDYNSAALRLETVKELDVLYDFLQANPTIVVELSSHTDSRGSDAYNKKLSQERAQVCVDYLVKTKGIAPNRIKAKGYGESQPKNKCTNGVPCLEEEYQINRRTEVKILGL